MSSNPNLKKILIIVLVLINIVLLAGLIWFALTFDFDNESSEPIEVTPPAEVDGVGELPQTQIDSLNRVSYSNLLTT